MCVFLTNNHYGHFSDIVKTSGALTATAAAITFTWKRRAKWEPSEEDIPKGSQRVIVLISSVVTAFLWINSDVLNKYFYETLSLSLGGSCLLFVFLYAYLISVHTFEITITINRKKQKKKIIGGLKASMAARRAMEAKGFTVQKYFEKMSFEPDKVWSRESRAFAKVSFLATYILLVTTGTAALTAMAILISKNI